MPISSSFCVFKLIADWYRHQDEHACLRQIIRTRLTDKRVYSYKRDTSIEKNWFEKKKRVSLSNLITREGKLREARYIRLYRTRECGVEPPEALYYTVFINGTWEMNSRDTIDVCGVYSKFKGIELWRKTCIREPIEDQSWIWWRRRLSLFQNFNLLRVFNFVCSVAVMRWAIVDC